MYEGVSALSCVVTLPEQPASEAESCIMTNRVFHPFKRFVPGLLKSPPLGSNSVKGKSRIICIGRVSLLPKSLTGSSLSLSLSLSTLLPGSSLPVVVSLSLFVLSCLSLMVPVSLSVLLPRTSLAQVVSLSLSAFPPGSVWLVWTKTEDELMLQTVCLEQHVWKGMYRLA